MAQENPMDGGKKKDKTILSSPLSSLPNIDTSINNFLTGTKGSSTKPVRDVFGNVMQDFAGGASRPGVSSTIQANLDRALPGVDRYGEAAHNQSWYDQIGIKTANMLVNIPAGILEGAGYLYELGEGAVSGKWDFNNGFIEAMNSMKDPVGDVLRENPQAVFDMRDPAWWTSNMGGLVESVAQFYVPGVAIGKTLGSAATLIGEGLQLGTRGVKIAQAAAQGLTATSLSYMEGAMSGRDVYKSKYIAAYAKELNNLTSQGVDIETAKATAAQRAGDLASHAASTTVLTNVALTSALNYTSLGAVFKGHEDDVFNWIRRNGARAEGESFSAWRTRMIGQTAENHELRKLLTPGIVGSRGAQEAFQEGLEEVINHFAEQSGLRDDGTNRSIWGTAFSQKNIGNFMNDAFTQEGALNFMLGAVGGIGNTVVMENIPMKRGIVYDENMQPIMETTAAGKKNGPDGEIVTDESGTKRFKTKLYSSRSMSSTMNKQYYDRAVDALANDLQLIQTTTKDMQQTVIAGNSAKAEQLRMELANIGNLNAIAMGLGTVWQNEYRKMGAADNKATLESRVQPDLNTVNEQVSQLEETIRNQQGTGNVDPQLYEQLKTAKEKQGGLQQEFERLSQTTEAMEMGLAKDRNDNRYQQRASKMVNDLQRWDDRYTQLRTKYDSIDAKGSEIAESMFRREIELDINRDILNDERQSLEELRREREPDLVSSTNTRVILELSKHISKLTSIETDLQDLQTAVVSGNTLAVDKLAKKYRSFADNTFEGKAKALTNTLTDLHNRYNRNFEIASTALDEALVTPEAEGGYKGWLSKQDTAGLSSEQLRAKFAEAFAKNKSIDQELLQRTTYLGKLEAEQEAQHEAYVKATSQGGVKSYIKWMKDDNTRISKQLSDKVERANTYHRDNEANQKAVALAKDRMIKKLQYETTAKITNITNAIERLNGLEKVLLEDTSVGRIFGATEQQLNAINDQRTLLQIELSKLQEHFVAIEPAINSAYASTVDSTVDEDDNITPDNAPADTPQVIQQNADTTQAVNDTMASVANEFVPTEEEIVVEPSTEELVEEGVVIADETTPSMPASIPEVGLSSALSMFEAAHDGLMEVSIVAITTPTATQAVTVSQTGVQQEPFLLEAELARLGPETRNIVEERISQTLENRNAVNKDMFMDLVRVGKMPKNLPGAIIARMETAIQSIPLQEVVVTDPSIIMSDVNPEVLPSEGEVQEPEGAGDMEDTSQESEPDSTPTTSFNPSSDFVQLLNSPAMAKHSGLRIVDAASAVGLDQEYREGEVKYANGTVVYKKISMSEISKTDQAEKRMNPNFFKGGETAVLIVDNTYNGDQNIDDDFSNTKNPVTGKLERTQKVVSFSDFLDPQGKIKLDEESIANFPVKIQDANGNQAGYIRRGDWIKAQYPGAIDYRNVADIYIAGGVLVTDNVETQYERVMEMRRQIAENYNAGRSITYSVFEEKGPGQKIDNVKELPSGMWANKVVESCTKLLPDTSLKLGVVLNGSFYTDHGNLVDSGLLTDTARILMSEKYYAHGQTGALIQMANGQYDIALMNSRNLDKRDTDSVVRILELGMNPIDKLSTEDQSEIAGIQQETGYDVRNFFDLRSLINEHFTYTQKIKDDHMIIPTTRKEGMIYKPQFQIQLSQAPDGSVELKYGTTFSGLVPVTVKLRNLENGKLPTQVTVALSKGLVGRLKSIQLTGKYSKAGLNSKDSFNSIHYFPTTGWVKNVDNGGKVYNNFNEYAKSITTTDTNGTNKDSSGRYVYAVHPNIPIRPGVTPGEVTETSVMANTPMEEADPLTLPEDIPEDYTSFDDEDQYAFNPISNNFVKTPNPSIGKITNGVPLTIENLQRLYNFTPAENRNDKTPELVLQELGRRGIGEIAPGHNPFYICG
jgi:hypothetical protein